MSRCGFGSGGRGIRSFSLESDGIRNKKRRGRGVSIGRGRDERGPPIIRTESLVRESIG